jgi:hypothetical protein
MSYNQSSTPTVWNQVNEMFSVSDGGAIKSNLSLGKGSFHIRPEMAEYILLNIESFRQAVDTAKAKTRTKEISKELNKTALLLQKTLGCDYDTALGVATEVIRKRSA